MTEDFLYVRLRARTASFRIPTILSGTQLSLTMPAYSTIIGLISYAIDDKYVLGGDKIGFRYAQESVAMDLEKSHRWKRDNKSGKITYNETNPRNRQVHYYPTLELFLSNLGLREAFEEPKQILTLGRSQDIAKIELVKTVKAEAVAEGKLRSTLLPLYNDQEKERLDPVLMHMLSQGIIYTLPYDFLTDKVGYTRVPVGMQPFLALPHTSQDVTNIPNLYKTKQQSLEPDQSYPWEEEQTYFYCFSA